MAPGPFRVWSSLKPASQPPGPGVVIKDTTTSTKIGEVTMTWWSASNELNFHTVDKYHNPGWSNLVADPSKGTQQYTHNGVTYTYYPYTTTYTGSITAENGVTRLPIYTFETDKQFFPNEGVMPPPNVPRGKLDDYNIDYYFFFVQGTALVNGQMQIWPDPPEVRKAVDN